MLGVATNPETGHLIEVLEEPGQRKAVVGRLRDGLQGVAGNHQIEKWKDKRAEEKDDRPGQQIARGVLRLGDSGVLLLAIIAEQGGQGPGFVPAQAATYRLIEPEQDKDQVRNDIQPGTIEEVFERLQFWRVV